MYMSISQVISRVIYRYCYYLRLLNKSTKSRLTCKPKYVPESAKREPEWPHEIKQQPAKQSTRHTMIHNIDSEHSTQNRYKILWCNFLNSFYLSGFNLLRRKSSLLIRLIGMSCKSGQMVPWQLGYPNHVLSSLLRDKTDQHHYLKARHHDRQLVDKCNKLFSNNFIIHMLYTDCY